MTPADKSHDEPVPADADDTDSATDSDTDAPVDAREQMRLALERKKGRDAHGVAHEGGGSKASPAHTNAKVQREFRRKSGG